MYHPGPSQPTPEQRLLLMDGSEWESFIEECARQLMKEGDYQQVIPMGGAGDKGRDVCAYTQLLPDQDSWDLFQGKHYETALSPSGFASELAKFLVSVHEEAYTRPRKYMVCAPRIGPKLIDYIKNPESMRSWILSEWIKNNGDFGKFKKILTSDLKKFVESFPFEIIDRRTSADLLEIHSRSEKHWECFGVLAPRGANPIMPDSPHASEQNYVMALLRAYGEQIGKKIDEPTTIPEKYRKHFGFQRRLFYSAEGLYRFSRDKLPGSFEELIEQVDLGVATTALFPHSDGMTRLKEVLTVANTLQVNANPLSSRLQAGDLQGSCHHLANKGSLHWVDDDE